MNRSPLSRDDVAVVIERFNAHGKSLDEPLTLESVRDVYNVPDSPSYVTHHASLFERPLLAHLDMGIVVSPRNGMFVAGEIGRLVSLPCKVVVQITARELSPADIGLQMCDCLAGLIEWCNTKQSAQILSELERTVDVGGLVVLMELGAVEQIVSGVMLGIKMKTGTHFIGNQVFYLPKLAHNRTSYFNAVAEDSPFVQAVQSLLNYPLG